MIKTSRLVARALAIGLLFLATSGCADKSPDALMSSAKAYLAKGDHNAAVIQLKSALQAAPENGEARLLLGRSLIEQRDFLAAEKELRRALELGQPAEAVLPTLARALIETQNHGALIKEFANHNLSDAEAQAVFQTFLGNAYSISLNTEAAGRAYSAALKARPGFALARLGQASLLAANYRFDEALKEVETVIASEPKLAAALAVKGQLLRNKGDREGAKSSFEAAVSADGSYMPARKDLIQALIDEDAFDRAAAQIDAARKVDRTDLSLTYLEGVLQFKQGQLEKARDSAAQVLKYVPNHVPTLTLAGGVEARSRQYGAAESNLRKAISLAPTYESARRFLAVTYLQTNRPDKALEVLHPLLEMGAVKDPGLLMLVGQAYLANGDFKMASEYFSRASRSDGVGVMARTALGQAELARGNTEEGLKQLEDAAQKDTGDLRASVALITEQLRRGELDKALAAAQRLENRQPDNPIAQQVLGNVKVARKDQAGARKNFEKALQLQPSFLPAAVALTNLDVAAREYETARKRLEEFASRNPSNAQAYLALSELQARTGAQPDEVAGTIGRAVSADVRAVEPRLALINHHLTQRNYRLALQAAQEADAALPNEPRILSALAAAQDRSGNTNRAIETLNKLIVLQPQSSQGFRQLATLYARQKNFDAALETMKRAKRIAPDDAAVQRDLVGAYAMTGKLDEALKEIKAFQTRNPKAAAGYELEGDVHSQQKKWPAADRAYRDALKYQPNNGAVAAKLHSSMAAAGKASEAETYARKWLVDNPKDVTMRMELAGRALRGKKQTEAFGLYQQAVAIEPNNALALNNLASVAGELGDSRAIGYAERAVFIAPNTPAYLDTLGMLLVNKGEAKKGLEYLERARKLSPEHPVLRLNYAKALSKLGRKEEARKELEALKSVSADFPGKEEIDQLLKEL